MSGWEILTEGYRLVEAPTPLTDGSVVFSDVLGGGVHRWWPDGRVTTVVPRRRGVGGIARRRSGGIVCTGRDVIVVEPDGTSRTVVAVPDVAGWNDMAVDSRGRLWVGSVRFRVFDPDAEVVPGELWCIGADGRAGPVVTGVVHANGVGFSPDGSLVYVSDTRSDVVIAAVADDGTVVGRFPVRTPDGLHTDTGGHLWVASYLERRIVRLTPDGREVASLDTDGRPVTSVRLGPDGTLLATTATAPDGRPGALMRTTVDATGTLPAAAL